jgi:two-component system, cell cycle sensor histidine kinase and response regulator CckA
MTDRNHNQKETPGQSAQKRAEEALRESEQSLRNLADNLQNAMVYQLTAEPDGSRRFTFISRAVERLNETTAEEALADASVIYRQVLPDYLEVVKEREAQALKNLTPFRVEVQSRLPSGRLRWFDYSSTPRYQADGLLVWDGVEVDVTERKQAEEALRQSEERLREVIEYTPAGYFSIDRAGRFQSVNSAWLRMHGYESADEVIGRHFSLTQVETDLEASQRKVEMLLTGGAIPSGEFSRRCRDGSVGYHTFSARPVIRAGEIVGIEGFLIDITERKRAEEEKAKLEAQLLQAQKMESVGRLAGGVAHDFNNMLSVIMGYAELALGKVNPTESLQADLAEIITAAERSAKIIRQLLAFARKQTVAPKVLNLNRTVMGSLKMLERLIGEEIRLNLRPNPDLWPVKVDPSQIDQILANLCINARDAISGVGEITIVTGNASFDLDHCTAHAGILAGEYVRLAVRDDGCGMDKETLAHIFEPFYTTKGVGKGSGLGLAMVYGAVQQNNGFIDASSEPGKGTTVTIYLPRYVGETGKAHTECTPGAVIEGQETILLVEDEPAVLTLTRKMLERQGYTVLAANSAGEAIRLARKHSAKIDLLMTDVIMPGMNGRDLWQALKALLPDIQCLFMSGYPANAIADRGILEEGAHFLQKPFAKKDLGAKVREALDEKAASAKTDK